MPSDSSTDTVHSKDLLLYPSQDFELEAIHLCISVHVVISSSQEPLQSPMSSTSSTLILIRN